MAETTITGLPNAATLTGAERVPMDQGGTTVDATTAAIAGLAPQGTVTSVGLVAPTGFSVSGSPVTAAGNITLTFAAGYSVPTTASQTTWDTAYTERLRWDGGSAGLNASTAHTSLGLATVATTGAYSDLSGRPTLFDPASPGAIGSTAPAAGTFTRLILPAQGSAPSTPSTGFTLYANASNAFSWRGANGFVRVFDGTANTADRNYVLPDVSGTVALAEATLPLTFSAGTITYSATTDLDMAALAGGMRTLSLTGNVTFTTSNRASGRTVTIRILCDSTQRTLTFPAGWVFVGTKPANIAASKTAVLSLTFFGTADTDCVAAYGVQA